MLNFYLVSAARHMVTDNDSSTTCRSKFKARSLKKTQKNKDPPKTWVSSNNRLKLSDKKKSKTPDLAWRTKQRNHKTPRAKTKEEPCSQEEKN